MTTTELLTGKTGISRLLSDLIDTADNDLERHKVATMIDRLTQASTPLPSDPWSDRQVS